MREIEFRGKQLYNIRETDEYYGSEKGTWRYGSYVYAHKYSGGEHGYLIYNHYGEFPIMCDKDTIGQYVGLKDKNGVKIFEGDVVKNDKGTIFVVEYFKYWSAFSLKIVYLFDEEENKLVRCSGRRYIYENEIYDIEIIGNVYDNPELLNK